MWVRAMITLTVPGLLDAVMHILLATLAMAFLFHGKNSIYKLFILSVILEFVTDRAHLVNKNITHNIFFFVEIPLLLLLVGYFTNKKGLEGFSLLILATNITHLIMDTAMEGGSVALYYPAYSGTYTWGISVMGSAELGGFLTWVIVLLSLKVVMFLLVRDVNPLQFPPPYRSGT